MSNSRPISQAELNRKFSLFISSIGDEKSDRFEKGLCNGYAFWNFYADFLDDKEMKKNLDRMQKIVDMTDENIQKMGCDYKEYKIKRRALIETIESEGDLPTLNRLLKEDYLQLTKFREEKHIDEEKISQLEKSILAKLNRLLKENYLQLTKLREEKPIDEEKISPLAKSIRQSRNERDLLVDSIIDKTFNQYVTKSLSETEDIYFYMHSLLTAFNPADFNFLAELEKTELKDNDNISIIDDEKNQKKYKFITQHDSDKILQLFSNNTEKKEAPLVGKNVFEIAFNFTEDELVRLFDNELNADTFRDGDFIQLGSTNHSIYLRKNQEGQFVLYDPQPITIVPNSATNLVKTIKERFFTDHGFAAGYMPLKIAILEKATPEKESKARPTPISLIKTIVESRTPEKNIDAKAWDNSTSVWMAAKYGLKDIIKFLHNEYNADVNIRGSEGTTPAHIAAQNGHAPAIKVLSEAGADFKMLHKDSTPAIIAAQMGHGQVITALSEAGVDVSTPNKNGITPAIFAALYDRPYVIKALGKVKAVNLNISLQGMTPVYIAAQMGHAQVITALTEAGANLNTPHNGQTPAYVAAGLGHAHVIKALADAKPKADLNTANNDGMTPVYIAARMGHAHVIKALAEAGADLNTLYNGHTPAYIAAEMGHAHVIKALAEAGANLNTTYKGHTPAYVAAEKGHPQVIKALADAKPKADLNTANNDGITPVYIAALKGHAHVITALAEAGANLNTTYKGHTPAYVAAEMGHPHVIKALADAKPKADLNTANNDGKTPVYIAAARGHTHVIKVLAEEGADLNKVNNDGTTPIYIAAQNGHHEVVALLREHQVNFNLPMHARIDILRKEAEKNEACIKNINELFRDKKVDETKFLDGFTPLHAAVFFGHTKVVAELIAANVDVNIKTKEYDLSALDFANAMNRFEILPLLKDALEAAKNKSLSKQRDLGASKVLNAPFTLYGKSPLYVNPLLEATPTASTDKKPSTNTYKK